MQNIIKNLSVVIPILREAANLQKLSDDIKENINLENYEIIFVDDNSNDGSEEILKRLNEKNDKIKYIIRKEEKTDLSKSCAVGFEKSLFDNILVMDGDQQHDPKDINLLIKAFNFEKADVVIGSRNLFNKKNEGLSFIRLKASQILIALTSLLLGKKTNDPMSGFFIFKKEIFTSNKKNMYLKGYKILFDLIYSTSEKIKIVDKEINFRRRHVGTSKMSLKIVYLVVAMILRRLIKKI